jgi:hypothetical protein
LTRWVHTQILSRETALKCGLLESLTKYIVLPSRFDLASIVADADEMKRVTVVLQTEEIGAANNSRHVAASTAAAVASTAVSSAAIMLTSPTQRHMSTISLLNPPNKTDLVYAFATRALQLAVALLTNSKQYQAAFRELYVISRVRVGCVVCVLFTILIVSF